MHSSFHTLSLSQVYPLFKGLDRDNPMEVIRFYSEYQGHIRQLDDKAYFEITRAYGDALVASEAYEQFVAIADELITHTLMDTSTGAAGKLLYQRFIRQKGESLIHLGQHNEAVHIFKELLKMDPNNRFYQKQMLDARLLHKPTWMNHVRAVTILMFLASAFVIAVEVLVVRTFFTDYSRLVELLRSLLFIAGVGTYLFGEWRVRQLMKKEIRAFIEDIHQRTNTKG